MAIGADASQEEVDSSVGQDLLLVFVAFVDEVGSITIQNVNLQNVSFEIGRHSCQECQEMPKMPTLEGGMSM